MVPDGVEISLEVMLVESVLRSDAVHGRFRVWRKTTGGPEELVESGDSSHGWEVAGSGQASDLRFLRQLPADGIASLHLQAPIVPGSFAAVTHLAAGLRRLYLAATDLADDALASVGMLHGLVYLQTWGNRFTDHGVQQLASLTKLESLYLEEETLTAAAFDSVASLPYLARLGIQDVPITEDEFVALRRQFPGVRIGR
jgi:hypothetical protein